jgi:hypothetical protein
MIVMGLHLYPLGSGEIVNRGTKLTCPAMRLNGFALLRVGGIPGFQVCAYLLDVCLTIGDGIGAVFLCIGSITGSRSGAYLFSMCYVIGMSFSVDLIPMGLVVGFATSTHLLWMCEIICLGYSSATHMAFPMALRKCLYWLRLPTIPAYFMRYRHKILSKDYIIRISPSTSLEGEMT